MAVTERTLSIIKPDAVRRHIIGDVIQRFERAGLHIIAMQMQKLDAKKAGEFYAVHKERPFYEELVQYISSYPVVVMVLEGPDAIRKNREIMGATNPSEASAGTIRHDISLSISENSVHGSDGEQTAREEIKFFFPELA